MNIEDLNAIELTSPSSLWPKTFEVEGWRDFQVLQGAAACICCGGTVSLMVSDTTDEIACQECIVWGRV